MVDLRAMNESPKPDGPVEVADDFVDLRDTPNASPNPPPDEDVFWGEVALRGAPNESRAPNESPKPPGDVVVASLSPGIPNASTLVVGDGRFGKSVSTLVGGRPYIEVVCWCRVGDGFLSPSPVTVIL